MSDSRRGDFEIRESVMPGSRTLVKLELAEPSLSVLLEGIDVERCWLTDEGDGVYGFHATQTLGVSRAQGGRPAVDALVEKINALGDAIYEDDVPQRLRNLWEHLVDDYKDETAPRTGDVG